MAGEQGGSLQSVNQFLTDTQYIDNDTKKMAGTDKFFLDYWKCNFPMNPDVRMLECHNFP